METQKFVFFSLKKFEIEFDLYFDLCWRAEINFQVGLNMHLYVDIGDASSSLWGSTSSIYCPFAAAPPPFANTCHASHFSQMFEDVRAELKRH